jgi:hypothetical protein
MAQRREVGGAAGDEQDVGDAREVPEEQVGPASAFQSIDAVGKRAPSGTATVVSYGMGAGFQPYRLNDGPL